MTSTLDHLISASTSAGVDARTKHQGFVDSVGSWTTYAVSMPTISFSSLVFSGTGYGTVVDSTNRDFAQSLNRIKDHSGLSWGEIARTVGVSRRTVHNWLTSSKVNGVNVRRVAGLYRAVTQELTAIPRESARSYLLAPNPDGDRLATIARDLRARYPHSRPAVDAVRLLESPRGVEGPLVSGGVDATIETFDQDDV